MHPNVFLKNFWQPDTKNQIFVAMSFAPKFRTRFETIIKPAIESILLNNVPLVAFRVDNSKTGDSILTEIMDGIAHSQMVLADVSSVGRDKVTDVPYRNGNVMYEVGIALACRPPQDVLLIRDDSDQFLFDVSTIPHMTLDFTNQPQATIRLHEELKARLQQKNFVNDARVRMAIHGLSALEIIRLKGIAANGVDKTWGRPNKGQVDFVDLSTTPRLLDKGLVRVAGEFDDGTPAYQLTQLGKVVAQLAQSHLRNVGKPEGTFQDFPFGRSTVDDAPLSPPSS